MILGGTGGASTQTGLLFEKDTDLKAALEGISSMVKVNNDIVYVANVEVARLYQKNKLYKLLLEPKGIKWKDIVSKKLLPDDALLSNGTLFIIEKKYQQTAGSVDEKLQTCDFKKKQYTKLMAPLGIKVEYIYVLNDFFTDQKYRDVLEYINSVGCYYYFNQVPAEKLLLLSLDKF